MTEKVVLEIPAELAKRLRALAAYSHQPMEAMIVRWMDEAAADPEVEMLSDDQVLALCEAQLDQAEQRELSDLLALHREGPLPPQNRDRLDELMTGYRRSLRRKALAWKVAVSRGLKKSAS